MLRKFILTHIQHMLSDDAMSDDKRKEYLEQQRIHHGGRFNRLWCPPGVHWRQKTLFATSSDFRSAS